MLSTYYCMPGTALRVLYSMSHLILRTNRYRSHCCYHCHLLFRKKYTRSKIESWHKFIQQWGRWWAGIWTQVFGLWSPASGAHSAFWLMGSSVWWFRASQPTLRNRFPDLWRGQILLLSRFLNQVIKKTKY